MAGVAVLGGVLIFGNSGNLGVQQNGRFNERISGHDSQTRPGGR